MTKPTVEALFEAARTAHRMVREARARGIDMPAHIEIGPDAWDETLIEWPDATRAFGWSPPPTDLYGLPVRVLAGNIPANGWRIVIAMGVIE